MQFFIPDKVGAGELCQIAIYTVITLQNMQFQVGIYPEKIQLDQVQNGR